MDISLFGGRLWAYTAHEIIVKGVARNYYLKGHNLPPDREISDLYHGTATKMHKNTIA